MALQFDQYNNQLKVNDSTNANASLTLTSAGTGSILLSSSGNNFLTQTSTLSTWGLNNTTITTGQTDPFNGTNANLLTKTAISQASIRVQTATLATGQAFTFSVYVLAGTLSSVTLLFTGDNGTTTNGKAVYNLSTQTITTTGSTSLISSSITLVGGGWYRCSLTATLTVNSNCYVYIYPDNNSSTTAGTVTVYGPQLEIGSVTNTYIPTTTIAIYNTPQLTFAGVAGLGLQSDGSLYVSPTGTGALQAQATTSSTVGGNARGANAVDWQTNRNAAAQVASGLSSTISGGYLNTASAAGSTIAGGYNNSNAGSWAFLGGGYQNTIPAVVNQSPATLVGGFQNNASGYSNFIGGGALNSGTATAQVTTQVTTIAVTAGTTFYISGVNASIKVGQLVQGTGVTGQTYATSTVTTGTTAANTAFTSTGSSIAVTTGILTVGTLSSGTIVAGQVLTGTGVPAGTYIVSNISGSGTGSTWNTNITTAVASTTITGTAYTLTISQNATTTAGVTLSFYTPHGVVVGGGNNQATGSYSFIGGGGDAGTAANRNVASGDWSFVGGGGKNLASGAGAFIGGGGLNSAGQPVYGNTASGLNSFVGGGEGSNASASFSVVSGGLVNTANGTYSSILGGTYGITRGIQGNTVFPAGAAPLGGSAGLSQSALLILGKQTTDATATVLTSDGNAATTTNQVIMPNNSAYYFRGELIAGVTGGGNTKGWSIEGVIKRGANAAATSIVGTATVTSLYADAGAATWALTATADTTNGGLAITVTGQAATTIRWVAQIRTTEMTY